MNENTFFENEILIFKLLLFEQLIKYLLFSIKVSQKVFIFFHNGFLLIVVLV